MQMQCTDCDRLLEATREPWQFVSVSYRRRQERGRPRCGLRAAAMSAVCGSGHLIRHDGRWRGGHLPGNNGHQPTPTAYREVEVGVGPQLITVSLANLRER